MCTWLCVHTYMHKHFHIQQLIISKDGVSNREQPCMRVGVCVNVCVCVCACVCACVSACKLIQRCVYVRCVCT